MTLFLLFLSLVCLLAVGGGVALLRATKRAPISASGAWPTARAWAGTLHGRRALGSGITVAAALLFVFILALRP